MLLQYLLVAIYEILAPVKFVPKTFVQVTNLDMLTVTNFNSH